MQHEDELKRIVRAYGPQAQILQAIQEMAELTKELTKYLAGRDVEEKITDEMADVGIMFDQLRIIFKNDLPLDMRREFKVTRQIERLEGVEEQRE